MTRPEQAMLAEHLRPGLRYLEFGGGGSTRFAIEQGVVRCDTIETDAEWIASLERDPPLARAIARGQLELHHIDVGVTAEWGIPANTRKMDHWAVYFTGIWAKLAVMPDVVLVDGRFRTATALAALLWCPPTTAILMHDFDDQVPWRKNYKRVLSFADIIGQTGHLVSLRRKPDVSNLDIFAMMGLVWADFT